MEPRQFLDFLKIMEKMKCNTRHSWTSTGRHESVAEHSWRLTVMAFLLKNEFPELDMDRVLKMCLIHDWGEAVMGDIPSFLKTENDENRENNAVSRLLGLLPGDISGELEGLFSEMDALSTPEARLYKALDNVEAVIQHNEADLSTWIPIEYELNRTYGADKCAEFDFMRRLREEIAADTDKKVKQNAQKGNE